MSQRERQPVPETPAQTVERFIGFTKTIFSKDSHDLDVLWEYEMNKLYGNEELLRVTKNVAYMGVKDVKESLVEAVSRGGLPLLRARFLVLAIENTQVGNMQEPLVTAFDKELKFN